MKYVRRLPCEICVRLGLCSAEPQTSPVSSAHHPRTGAGAGRKNPDEDTIALCPGHHQNSNLALHVMGRKAWERHFGVTEAELTLSTALRVQQMIAMEV
jgi:hypothetical protein